MDNQQRFKELSALYDKNDAIQHIINLEDRIEECLRATLVRLVWQPSFDDADMKYVANRIDPAFWDIELDGVQQSREDFLRKLKIIINDRIADMRNIGKRRFE